MELPAAARPRPARPAMPLVLPGLQVGGARVVSAGCTDDVMSSAAVAMVRKHAANPENLIAGTLQRSIVETCRLLTEGMPTLRTYAESCGAEPDVNQRVARALVTVRAMLCAESTVSSDAASEWPCWQPRATSFWNCAQQPGWTASPQACQLLDKMSECYERVAAEWCSLQSGRAMRRIVLRALAPLPDNKCEELERAAHRAGKASSGSWLLAMGLFVLANAVFAAVVLACCTWCRRRQARRQAKLLGEHDDEPR